MTRERLCLTISSCHPDDPREERSTIHEIRGKKALRANRVL